MIREYAIDLAAQMGMQLSRVSVIEGQNVGALDVYLLHIESGSKLVSTLVYQSEHDDLHRGISSDRLEVRIRSPLSRLQMLLEP